MSRKRIKTLGHYIFTDEEVGQIGQIETLVFASYNMVHHAGMLLSMLHEVLPDCTRMVQEAYMGLGGEAVKLRDDLFQVAEGLEAVKNQYTEGE